MRFSIVIPAHNGGRYLQFTLKSALNQVRKADEIILFDDASTDQTAAIAKSPEWSASIKYFYNEKSTGFVDAWNRAIAKSTGDFVTILHQDDLLHPEYIAQVEKALQKYPYVKHIYTGCNYVDGKGNVIGGTPGPYSLEPVLLKGEQYARNYLRGMVNYQHIHRCPGVTTSKDLLLKDCSYRKEAGLIADDDFFLRVGAFTDVIGISEHLASFRIHSESVTGSLNNLAYELAKAYVFQSYYYKDRSSLLGRDVICLNKFAVRYINLVLFNGLVFGKKDWEEAALNFRKDIDSILPGFLKKNVPRWAGPLWIGNYKSASLEKIISWYAKALYDFLQIKHFLKK
jgi:glycosyltransferase involved in cell wall biosynthesis